MMRKFKSMRMPISIVLSLLLLLVSITAALAAQTYSYSSGGLVRYGYTDDEINTTNYRFLGYTSGSYYGYPLVSLRSQVDSWDFTESNVCNLRHADSGTQYGVGSVITYTSLASVTTCTGSSFHTYYGQTAHTFESTQATTWLSQ